jgi:hypothetical protein
MNKPVQGVSGTRGRAIADFGQMLFSALTRRTLTDQSATAFIAPPGRGRGVSGAPSNRVIKRSHRVSSGKVERRRIRHRKAEPLKQFCRHVVLKHDARPHPKYGDAVPYFRSYLDAVECDCDSARVTSSIRRRLRREERALQAPTRGAPTSSPASGTPDTQTALCGRRTKLGTQCRRKARPSGFCAWHEEHPVPIGSLGRGA